MSEKLRSQQEQFEKLDDKNFADLEKQAAAAHDKAAERAKDKANEIDSLLKKVEKEATSKAELSKHHQQKKPTDREPDAYSHHQLATQTFNQTIKKVQRNLPAPQRIFSKFVHNPRIETASDIVGGTIARPLGLFWGGLFSVIASVVVLILCRYYGYEYNFSIGLLSFIGGYCLGISVELTIKLIKRLN